jgi:hypothetical protein
MLNRKIKIKIEKKQVRKEDTAQGGGMEGGGNEEKKEGYGKKLKSSTVWETETGSKSWL